MKSLSTAIELVHTTRDELDRGRVPHPAPEVLLIEVGSDEWYRNEIPAQSCRRGACRRLS